MTRRCKCGCGAELPPASQCTEMIQKKRFHGIDCYVAWYRADKKKKAEQAQRKKHRAQKQKIRDNDRGYHLKQAQAAFNAFVRELICYHFRGHFRHTPVNNFPGSHTRSQSEVCPDYRTR